MSANVAELLGELKSRFGVEPADGIQFLTSDGLLRRPFDPGMAVVLLPDQPAAAANKAALPGRTAHAAGAAQLLRSLYPAEHAVHGIDGAPDSTIGDTTDEGLAASTHFIL